MYKEDLALNNKQWLICHKTQTTKKPRRFICHERKKPKHLEIDQISELNNPIEVGMLLNKSYQHKLSEKEIYALMINI